MFLSEILWGFQPHTLSYFLLVQKVTKNTHGGRNPFDGVSPPVTPSSATTQRGTPVPLWNPPQEKRLVLVGDGYSRGCA